MQTPRLINPSGVAQNVDVAALREHVMSNRRAPTPGQVGVVGPAGSIMGAARGFRGTPYPSRRGHPWQLAGSIEVGPVAKIYTRPGMVNNFVPTIGGVSLAAVPRPGISVTGAFGIIQLKATVDAAGSITDLIAENVAGPTVAADTATEKYKLVGTWTASGGAFTSVTSILNTNQTFRVCGGNAEWY